MTTNRDTFLRQFADRRFRAPRWTRGTWGERFMGVWALLTDSVLDGARQATRLPLVLADTPPDALPRIGEMRALPRYPSESEAHYRVRLDDHWEQHQRMASPAGLREQFQAAGYDIEVVEPFSPAEAFEGAPVVWSEYALRVHGYGSDPCTPLDYDLPDWGSGWAWGTSLSSAVCQEILDIARRCAPARSRFAAFRCPEARAAMPTLTHRWRASEGTTISPPIAFSSAFSSAFAISGTVSAWVDDISSIDLAPLTSNDLLTAAINGRPAIDLTTGMQTTTDLSVSDGSVATIYLCVRREDDTPNTACLLEAENPAGTEWFRVFWSANLDGRIYVSDSSGSAVATDVSISTDTRCIVIAKNGTRLRFYADGLDIGEVSIGVSVDMSGVLTVGSTSGGSDPFEGVIAEAGIAIGEAASVEQARRLSTYCRDYYASTYLGVDFAASPWVRDSRRWRDLSWSATTPDPFGEQVLPDWLHLVCRTEGTTSQQSATTLRTSYGVNAPRSFSTDGATWFFPVEPPAMNLVTSQDLSAWSTGSATINSATGPDGVAAKCEAVDADVLNTLDKSDSTSISAWGAVHTLSAWTQVVAISAGVPALIVDPNAGSNVPRINFTGGIDADWVYRTNTDTIDALATDANIRSFPATTSTAVETGTLRTAFIQVEQRAYPTSFVDGTRQATILYADVDAVAPKGYFDVELSWREVAGSAARPLLGFEDGDMCSLDGTTITAMFGGITASLTGVTLADGDDVSIRVQYLPGRLSITLAGATAGDGTATTTGALDPLEHYIAMFLGCYATGAVQSMPTASVTSTSHYVESTT